MATGQPPSFKSDLDRIRAAAQELSNLSLVRGLRRIAPGLPAAALAGLAAMSLAWTCEHQARRREGEAARQEKKQASEQISQLQQKAAGAVRAAQQSTQAAQQLEAQRQQLTREAQGLRQSLGSLRKEELARTSEVATLPAQVVEKRVASRLGEQVSGVGGQVSGEEQASGATGEGLRTAHPLTRPAAAGENAVAGHPLPQGGEGWDQQGGEGRDQQGGEGWNPVPGEGGNHAGGEGTNPVQGGGGDQNGAMVLSEQGARKVESAFIELDSCRQQGQVMGQEISNCEQQAKVDKSLQDQQANTITQLKAALADKDQILARSEQEHKAELKAARGTWQTRLYHALEVFAGGFIAGVMVR